MYSAQVKTRHGNEGDDNEAIPEILLPFPRPPEGQRRADQFPKSGDATRPQNAQRGGGTAQPGQASSSGGAYSIVVPQIPCPIPQSHDLAPNPVEFLLDATGEGAKSKNMGGH